MTRIPIRPRFRERGHDAHLHAVRAIDGVFSDPDELRVFRAGPDDVANASGLDRFVEEIRDVVGRVLA